MGRPTKTERLKEARPLVMQSTLTFCRLNLQKLYARTRRLNLANIGDEQDYADYIHSLWNTMLTHDELKIESLKLEEILGTGDAIQLLNDVVMDHRASSNGE